MSYMKLMGALLLLASCGGLGAAQVFALRRSIADVGELRRAAEKMETEICMRRRSVPEAAAMLETDFPRCFSGISNMKSLLQDEPFADVWRKHFQSLELPPDAENAIILLGGELSGGTNPEKAFSLCIHQLRSAEESLRDKLEKNGKVYIAAGLTAGSLLVFALI